MAIEMVVPMENLADPIPSDFTFKCTNTNDIAIYVKSELVTPPAGWNTTGAELHGSLGVGVDDYFLNDNNTRDRPANLTEETVDFKISYYSDAGYTLLITSETLQYTITYVDFDDVGFTVVDDDTFEVDLEGWAYTQEVGAGGSSTRSTTLSRTGVASDRHFNGAAATNAGYQHKNFTIGAVTRAFIRIWVHFFLSAVSEIIFELITDAGEVSQKRTLAVAMDGAPKGGTEICKQWICLGLKLPVNGTYQVRLRIRNELSGAGDYAYYDDIRVVQS